MPNAFTHGIDRLFGNDTSAKEDRDEQRLERELKAFENLVKKIKSERQTDAIKKQIASMLQTKFTNPQYQDGWRAACRLLQRCAEGFPPEQKQQDE